MHHDQVSLSQECRISLWFWKSVNVIQQTKTEYVISVYAKKAFDKIKFHFWSKKKFSKLEIERNLLNLMKYIYQKPYSKYHTEQRRNEFFLPKEQERDV